MAASAFDKHRAQLEIHETMMGRSRGRLAVAERLVGVHLQAECAAVDLRRAQLDQVVERRLDVAGDERFHLHQVPIGIRVQLVEVEAGRFDHGAFLFRQVADVGTALAGSSGLRLQSG